MSRKMLVLVLSSVILASIHIAEAQQAKKAPRIGFVSGRGEPTPINPDPSAEAFQRELQIGRAHV